VRLHRHRKHGGLGQNSMLNAAIVGLGWWGRELARSVQGRSDLIRIRRGVTLEPELAKEFAAKMNFALGTSYQDVLDDPAIDAVILATPHTRHREQVEVAAAHGKHVFCEKPFALSLEDAQAAIAACRRANVGLGVGQNRRMWPSVVAIKDLIASGQFGTVMFAEGNYSHDLLAATPLDNWRSAPKESRAGGMTGMGIHLLDALSFLIGPLEKVSALSTRRVLPLAAGDTTQALLGFCNGATATISTTLNTPGFVWRLAIYGSDMWAESLGETKVVTGRAKGEPATFEAPPTNHIGLNIESFARAALGEDRFHIDDEGILHTVAALEAVFRSTEANGAWQQVA
jgi:predicted dehydrogenase